MSEVGTIGSMPVSAFIGGPVARIAPDATLLDVADALTAGDIGLLAVHDGHAVVGVVSERDLVHALAKRLPPDTTSVMEVASTQLAWCDLSATVSEVATEMLERYVRHILVEQNGRLVGLVSARDLLGAYALSEPEVED